MPIQEQNIYESVAAEVAQLVQEKQEAYGDSFGRSHKIIEVLYPDGIPPDKMTDALAITRVIDKLFRIATRKDAFGEDPWRDILGYALLAVVRNLGDKIEYARPTLMPMKCEGAGLIPDCETCGASDFHEHQPVCDIPCHLLQSRLGVSAICKQHIPHSEKLICAAVKGQLVFPTDACDICRHSKPHVDEANCDGSCQAYFIKNGIKIGPCVHS